MLAKRKMKSNELVKLIDINEQNLSIEHAPEFVLSIHWSTVFRFSTSTVDIFKSTNILTESNY